VSEQKPDLQELTVPTELTGQRLDHVLARLSGLSRSRIKQLLQEGHISGPHPGLKLSASVRTGERYRIDLPETRPLELQAQAIELDILYEDQHLLVVNKPPGMVVHPSHGHDSGTLVHALLHHCPTLPGINGVERPGIVHRLDKDTSGSLVIAKTEAAHHGLVALFATHDIRREYIAWCRGVPGWGQKRIELPIGRHPQHRQKMAVNDKGKHAITDAALEKRYDDAFCRMRLTLHTGRTHQIRVHLAHERLPILGDAVYARSYRPGNRVPEPARTAIEGLARQALHAEVLGFIHPITHEEILCHAPLPDDLNQLESALREAYG
jgi:23S rRNA pseudouridine1911/1915/1917 synthase